MHWHDMERGHFRASAFRWLAAGLVIVLAHTGFVYAALFWHREESAAAPPAAVMIELAPMPVSAPSQTQDVAPGPEMMQAPQTTPDAPDEPEEEPAPTEPVKQEVAEDAPELPPTPVASEVVLPAAHPEPQPKPVEMRKPEEKPPEEKPKKEAKPTRRRQAPVTSAAPRSEAAPSQRTAAPSPGISASNSQARASWAAMISAHLNRFKRYPRGAEGVTGRPSVRFSLDGSGRVTSVSLVRSSGSSVLDDEAVATVRRASPFPAPPDGRGASFSVPVNFTRR